MISYTASDSRQTNRGFTLLELIISVAIIALVSTVISQVFFATTKSNAKAEIQKEVKQNGDYALGVMERMVRSAGAITSTCSSGGSTTTSLTITNPDFGSTTFGCDSTTGIARIASSSATGTVYLTSSAVRLGVSCTSSTLAFVCTTVAAVPKNVKINFTLAQSSTSPDVTEQSSLSFQSFVTVRP